MTSSPSIPEVTKAPDDGIIKYHCDWQKAPPATGPPVQELCTFRDQLHDLGLVHVGADGIGFGNVSVRSSGNEFLITGTQTGHIQRLTPSHCSFVESISVNRNRLRCKGPIAASSEALTHGSIYQFDPKIGAVVHVHHEIMWQQYLGRLPTTQADVPYGTVAMAREMNLLLSPLDLSEPGAIVMGGHTNGLISFGATLSAASGHMIALLKQCTHADAPIVRV